MGAHKKVNGVPWKDGVIANCKWGGIRLRDLLLHCGIQDQADNNTQLHVCFSSYATLCEDDTYYGASIPLERALDEAADVLIAFEVRLMEPTTMSNLSCAGSHDIPNIHR
jgi:sulfite oxidase